MREKFRRFREFSLPFLPLLFPPPIFDFGGSAEEEKCGNPARDAREALPLPLPLPQTE